MLGHVFGVDDGAIHEAVVLREIFKLRGCHPLVWQQFKHLLCALRSFAVGCEDEDKGSKLTRQPVTLNRLANLCHIHF